MGHSLRFPAVKKTLPAHASARLGASVVQDRIGGLLGDDVDGAGDEEARDAREHRRVDDAQAARAADAKGAVEHGAGVAVGADRARARRVVAPGGVANVVGERRVARRPAAPGAISSAIRPLAISGAVSLRTKRIAGDDRGQVGGGVVAAFLEVVEVDSRRVERVGRAQAHRAGAVFGVRLEDRPGQEVARVADQLGEARSIAFEARQQRHEEEVGLGPARAASG